MQTLTKTAEAVREYDKANKAFQDALDFQQGDNPNDNLQIDLQEELAKIEQKTLQVKEAFAEDTADINLRENALLVSIDGSNGWLRKMLFKQGFTDCALTKEIRQNRGWGW